MSRIVEQTVYKFEELSDSAKERARSWWRECENQDFDTEFLYDDFVTCGGIIGIEFDQKEIPLHGGGKRYDPAIYWSGFSSQGDGACFEGRYSYVKESVAKIIVHAPPPVEGENSNTRLHQIANNLAAIQRKHFYSLSARVKHSDRYYHEHSVNIEVFDDRTGDTVDADTTEAIGECLRAFMRWMYRQLEDEYNYRMSDEQVEDAITANEYDFTEDGERA